MLAVLLGLGTWQVQRLQWKEALLARLAAAEQAPPVPLAEDAPPEPWTRLSVTGRLDYTREALLGAEVRGNRMGATLVTPLFRPGAPPLLVLRGWVPTEGSPTVERPEGELTLTGYLRPAEPAGLMAAPDDPARRRFYSFDPALLGPALDLAQVAPYGLALLGEAAPTRLPQPATALPRPDNPHLGDAGTWDGLALTLLGVALALARRRWQEAP